MAMTVNNYVQSLRILNIMNRLSNARMKNMMHIATGKRIVNVADDPSGYAISQRMEMEIRGLDQDARNAQSSLSMMKVAEGAISSTVNILTTLQEKAVAAANGTATDEDRRMLQKEFNEYIDQIDDNSLVAFNGQYLLDGSKNGRAIATAESYTNYSLSQTTFADTPLTALERRNGDSLDILSSDSVSVSYVKQGKTCTTSFTVGSSTLSDIFARANAAGSGSVFDVAAISTDTAIGRDIVGNTIYTLNGENAVTVRANASGTENAVSGFTISISDSMGKVKKSVNAVLDGFSESIQARNASEDHSLIAQTGTHANQNMRMQFSNMSAAVLGLKGRDGNVIDVSTQKGANAAINVLHNALTRALDQSTTIGAEESRLGYTIQNLTSQSENLTAAMSTIMDADMAKEITEYAKNNILLQAAQAMLAQSNQNAGWFLTLLK
jgi:flagellin